MKRKRSDKESNETTSKKLKKNSVSKNDITNRVAWCQKQFKCITPGNINDISEETGNPLIIDVIERNANIILGELLILGARLDIPGKDGTTAFDAIRKKSGNSKNIENYRISYTHSRKIISKIIIQLLKETHITKISDTDVTAATVQLQFKDIRDKFIVKHKDNPDLQKIPGITIPIIENAVSARIQLIDDQKLEEQKLINLLNAIKSENNQEIIRAINSGANVRYKNQNDDNNILHHFVSKNNPAICELLLKVAPELFYAKNKQNISPSEIAISQSNEGILYLLKFLPDKELKEYFYSKDSINNIPMAAAAIKGDNKFISFLLNTVVDRNIINKDDIREVLLKPIVQVEKPGLPLISLKLITIIALRCESDFTKNILNKYPDLFKIMVGNVLLTSSPLNLQTVLSNIGKTTDDVLKIHPELYANMVARNNDKISAAATSADSNTPLHEALIGRNYGKFIQLLKEGSCRLDEANAAGETIVDLLREMRDAGGKGLHGITFILSNIFKGNHQDKGSTKKLFDKVPFLLDTVTPENVQKCYEAFLKNQQPSIEIEANMNLYSQLKESLVTIDELGERKYTIRTGNTPLHVALLSRDNIGLKRILLSSDAQLNQPNNKGITPFALICNIYKYNNSQRWWKLFNSNDRKLDKAFAKLLKALPFESKVITAKEMQECYLAFCSNKPIPNNVAKAIPIQDESVSNLIQSALHRYEIHLKRAEESTKGKTARVEQGSHISMVKSITRLVIDQYINNAVDNDGNTASHIAAQRNVWSCVEELLSKGAQIDIPNNAGMTVYDELRGSLRKKNTEAVLESASRYKLLGKLIRDTSLLKKFTTTEIVKREFECAKKSVGITLKDTDKDNIDSSNEVDDTGYDQFIDHNVFTDNNTIVSSSTRLNQNSNSLLNIRTDATTITTSLNIVDNSNKVKDTVNSNVNLNKANQTANLFLNNHHSKSVIDVSVEANAYSLREFVEYQYQYRDIELVGKMLVMEFNRNKVESEQVTYASPLMNGRDLSGMLIDVKASLKSFINELILNKKIVGIFNVNGNHWLAYFLFKDPNDEKIKCIYKDSLGCKQEEFEQVFLQAFYEQQMTNDLQTSDLIVMPSGSAQQLLAFEPVVDDTPMHVNCGIFALKNMLILAGLSVKNLCQYNENLSDDYSDANYSEYDYFTTTNLEEKVQAIEFFSPGENQETYQNNVKKLRVEFGSKYLHFLGQQTFNEMIARINVTNHSSEAIRLADILEVNDKFVETCSVLDKPREYAYKIKYCLDSIENRAQHRDLTRYFQSENISFIDDTKSTIFLIESKSILDWLSNIITYHAQTDTPANSVERLIALKNLIDHNNGIIPVIDSYAKQDVIDHVRDQIGTALDENEISQMIDQCYSQYSNYNHSHHSDYSNSITFNGSGNQYNLISQNNSLPQDHDLATNSHIEITENNSNQTNNNNSSVDNDLDMFISGSSNDLFGTP